MRSLMFGTLDRLAVFELPLCRRCNRLDNRALLALLRAVSWLGDYPIWVMMAAVIAAAGGAEALPVLRHMLLLAAVCLPLYKVLKGYLARERPCIAHPGIASLVAPLDRYSFPSGHTLHAVAFTLILVHYYPFLAWPLAPFTVLVALSRVILGVHYPSDVLAGVVLGTVFAAATFTVL